jgi:outer membrane protein OmpA-like peptidoglycan-associated protein
MSRQIILKTALAIIVAFSITNVASAQLKPSNYSKRVWIDLSVLDAPNAGWSSKQENIIIRKQSDLLVPPSKMPSSRYINIHSRGKNLHKSSGIESNLGAKLSEKRFKTKSVSAKIKLVKPKNKALKRLNTQTRILKPTGPRKLVPSPKRALKIPTKLSKASPPRPKFNKKNIAPAPKAVPLAPVKIIEIPPLTTKINKTVAKKKVISQQIATRSYKSNKQTTSKLLIFKQGGSNLSDQAKKTLDSLSIELKAKPNSRMQVKAYAGEPSLSSSKARRLSLSRALSVRSYLIKNGIRSTRIDVRALGNKTSVGAPNRVDLNIIKN